MATEVSTSPLMPRLQSVQKAMAIPTVGAAVGQVGALYTKLKAAHSLLEWALSTAEAGVVLAATSVAPYVSHPLAVGDAKLAAAIDSLEQRVPIVVEIPRVIVETTKQAVISRISPHMNKVNGARAYAGQRVQSLKELTWAKANALLNNIDSGAMQLFDHYLPRVGVPEETSTLAALTPASTDLALRTLQTAGRLGDEAARRMWANLAYKIHELRNSGIALDVRRYITALLAALHLAKATSQEQEEQEEEAKQTTNHVVQQSPLYPTVPVNSHQAKSYSAKATSQEHEEEEEEEAKQTTVF